MSGSERSNLATAAAWPDLDLSADHARWRAGMGARRRAAGAGKGRL